MENDRRQRPDGAGAIIYNSKYEVLLQLRGDTPKYPRCWVILGGKIEKGETAPATLRRELKEEIGLEDLAGVKEFHMYAYMDTMNPYEDHHQYIYTLQKDIDIERTILREGIQIKYFPRHALGSLDLGFNMMLILDDFFKWLENTRPLDDRLGERDSALPILIPSPQF